MPFNGISNIKVAVEKTIQEPLRFVVSYVFVEFVRFLLCYIYNEKLKIFQKKLNFMNMIDIYRYLWTIFMITTLQCEIGLTEQEIDDIIVTLDSNMDDELDYQEINKGLMQWKKNRRDLKKQGIAPKTPILSCLEGN